MSVLFLYFNEDDNSMLSSVRIGEAFVVEDMANDLKQDIVIRSTFSRGDVIVFNK